MATKKKAVPPGSAREGGAKSAATRARVLDAAATVLAQHGYAGTRLTDVAKQAKVQAPAIYYYFSSREDLIEEVIVTGISRMREHVEATLDAVPDAAPLDRIDAAIAAHLEHELSESDYARAAVRNAQQVPEELRSRYQQEAGAYGALWTTLFSAAADAGDLRPEIDPGIARLLTLGALNWSGEWWTPRRGSVTKVVAQAQAMVRRAISPTP